MSVYYIVMKILHVYKTFINDTMGGTQQVIANIIRNCPDKSIKFGVLSLASRATGVDLSFMNSENIHYEESFTLASNPVSFALIKDFGRIIKDYDVIHYHFPWPFADLLNLVWRVSKPTLVTYHSDIVKQKSLMGIYKPLMNNFLGSVKRIVATSQNYLDSSTVLQSYKHKASVIPIGINFEDYIVPSVERLAYWKNKFGERFFFFVGVMRYYKGLNVLLEAMRGTDYPLVIAGSGPIEKELKSYAEKHKLKNVHFVGQLSEEDKSALLKLCTSLVFPSNLRSEAFGISLLEGAMFGKPMISTELGTGTSFVNKDGETGIVVPPNDPQALQRAMVEIWNNPEVSSKMAQSAKERHQSLFTANKMAAEYTNIYKDLGQRN